MQLGCEDPRARRLAETAFETTHRMHEATDDADRLRRSDEAKEALARFVEAAAPGVR
ncbi:hypothetical protein [Streptomyces sp. NPDC053431]|uniref:hypothetical protein n=1 Tax=Streptomyces sp. NPDC053431 TaxID=3365703 RepID=UPI0037D1DFF5